MHYSLLVVVAQCLAWRKTCKQNLKMGSQHWWVGQTQSDRFLCITIYYCITIISRSDTKIRSIRLQKPFHLKYEPDQKKFAFSLSEIFLTSITALEDICKAVTTCRFYRVEKE